MKTRLIFLLLLIVSFSCGTNNKPVSDAQKEKIKGEIKEVNNTMLKALEEADFNKAIEPYYNSPDFVFYFNGTAVSYKDIVEHAKNQYSTHLNQKITVLNERYEVLDNSTVLYTVNDKCLDNYKDGHSVLADPETLLFIFKKINNKWRIIYGFDSFVEQSVANAETSKELNQVELMKQLLGTWKSEVFQDTIWSAECISFGNGLEWHYKVETKGKIVSEAKALMGYDKKNNKLIECDLSKSSSDISLHSIWFTSANKFEEISLEDISNPEKATFITINEFKSTDLLIETDIKNNKTIGTYTFHRVKK